MFAWRCVDEQTLFTAFVTFQFLITYMIQYLSDQNWIMVAGNEGIDKQPSWKCPIRLPLLIIMSEKWNHYADKHPTLRAQEKDNSIAPPHHQISNLLELKDS